MQSDAQTIGKWGAPPETMGKRKVSSQQKRGQKSEKFAVAEEFHKLRVRKTDCCITNYASVP